LNTKLEDGDTNCAMAFLSDRTNTYLLTPSSPMRLCMWLGFADMAVGLQKMVVPGKEARVMITSSLWQGKGVSNFPHSGENAHADLRSQV
jgi:hypothetical protein